MSVIDWSSMVGFSSCGVNDPLTRIPVSSAKRANVFACPSAAGFGLIMSRFYLPNTDQNRCEFGFSINSKEPESGG